MSPYPPGWPRCPQCDAHALDGHITCGRAQCEESFWRRFNEARYRLSRRQSIDGDVVILQEGIRRKMCKMP